MNSLWFSENEIDKLFTNKPSTDKLETDVCIIGAGIFGITCAYYLSKLGYKVIVLEKDKIGGKTTGHTTAKITSQHGLFYDYLTNSYSKKHAHDYLYANEKAIENIKSIIDEEDIKCDFEYQNNYVYSTNKEDLKSIKKEIKTVQNLGYNCEFVTKTGLPFDIQGAICFKNQAQFHPLKYIYGLCKCIINNNGNIYTNNTVYDVKKDEDYYTTYSNSLQIKSKYVIVATHYPFINFPGFYFTKMYQSTSYVLAITFAARAISFSLMLGVFSTVSVMMFEATNFV